MTPKRESRAPAPLVKVGPQSSMQVTEFASAIQANGLAFRWSRAVECPCSMVDTDQPAAACVRCHGDGWWYVNPAAYDEPHASRDYLTITAIFAPTGQTGQRQEPMGSWDSGEGTMTFDAHLTVGWRDRFVSRDQRMARSETLIRGTSDIVAVGKSRRATAAQREALRYEPLHVSFVASGDSDTATIYYPRRDYRLLEPTEAEPARLAWLSGRGPAAGERYTVHYDFRPVWIVDGAPQAYATALPGPPERAKGERDVRFHPSSFRVLLDFLTPARGP